MKASGLSGDLEWWRANRDDPEADPVALRAVLDRLMAWKVQHDRDRAGQPGPFLQMVWDGIFADEDSDVVDAIRELEEALGRPDRPSAPGSG